MARGVLVGVPSGGTSLRWLNDMCRFRPPQSEKKKNFFIFFFFSRFAIESCSARFLFAFSTLPFRFFRKSKISATRGELEELARARGKFQENFPGARRPGQGGKATTMEEEEYDVVGIRSRIVRGRRYWKLRYRRLGLLVQKRLGLHARGVSSSTRIIQKPKWRNEDRHGGGGVVDVRWDGSLRSGLPPSQDLLPPPPAGLRPKACDRGVEFREVHAGLRVLVLQGLQHHLDLVDVLQEPRLLRLPGLVFPPQLANFQCRLASFLERVHTRARKK